MSGWMSRYLDRLLTRRAALPMAPPAPGAEAVARRQAGTAIWFRCSDAGSVRALSGLFQRLTIELPGAWPLVTLATEPPPEDEDAIAEMAIERASCPTEDLAAVSGFLDRWHPAAAVLLGDALLPATVQGLRRRNLPVLGADLRLPSGSWMERGIYRALARRHLAGFAYLQAEDMTSLLRLRQLGAAEERSAIGGAFRAEVPVPPANEAERVSMAELLSSRPVWCAYGLPLAEIAALAEAQALALGRSHRLLLVVMPEDAQDGPAMQQALDQAGLSCGLRSAGDEPTEHLSAYVADLGGEAGLWLRLAPLTYVGGTLTEAAGSRTPLEPAALGSAILHGPEIAQHAADHARLTAAGGARLVQNAAALAAEIEALTAPDQAAALAHAAWEASSAGDEAATRLLDRLALALTPPRRETATGTTS